jgi:hypothetical protein
VLAAFLVFVAFALMGILGAGRRRNTEGERILWRENQDARRDGG